MKILICDQKFGGGLLPRLQVSRMGDDLDLSGCYLLDFLITS